MKDWFEIVRADKGSVDIRICWWRPTFFRMSYRAIRQQGVGRLYSLYLACLLVIRFAVKP